MGILVRDNGIQVPVGKRCLVNAQIRTDVPRKHEPSPRMVLVLPITETAQVVLIATLELIALDVIRLLERTSCNRGCIQGILLKKIANSVE